MISIVLVRRPRETGRGGGMLGQPIVLLRSATQRPAFIASTKYTPGSDNQHHRNWMSYEFVEDETSNYAFRFPACVTQSPSRLCYLCNWVTPASSGSSSNATTSYMFSLYYHIGLVKIYYWFELTRAMVDFMWLMCYVYIPPNWLRLALTFLPEASIGLRVLSLPASVRPSVSPSVTKFVRAITHHPFKLGSLNLDHRCKRPWLRSLLFWGVIDPDLQGQI